MLVFRLFVVLVLGMPCLFAVEFSKIEVDRGKTSEEVVIRWDVPPKVCESKMYKWDGESLNCMTVDRLGILQAHKNLNFNAWRACTAEVVFLKNKAVVHAIHDDAREKCRVLGKRFNEDAVICAGSLREGAKL